MVHGALKIAAGCSVWLLTQRLCDVSLCLDLRPSLLLGFWLSWLWVAFGV